MGRCRHHDHALSGEWAGYRDCHVKPDLVRVFTAGVRAMRCASEENGWPCRRPAAWPTRRVTSSPDHSPARGPGKPPSSLTPALRLRRVADAERRLGDAGGVGPGRPAARSPALSCQIGVRTASASAVSPRTRYANRNILIINVLADVNGGGTVRRLSLSHTVLAQPTIVE